MRLSNSKWVVGQWLLKNADEVVFNIQFKISRVMGLKFLQTYETQMQSIREHLNYNAAYRNRYNNLP